MFQIRNKLLLCQILRECISIWKFTNKLLFFLCHFIHIFGHDVLYNFIYVLSVAVYFLLDQSWPITISVGSWHMSEYIEILAFLGQLKHTLTAKIVDLKCILQRVVEVDGCCTIYDNLDLTCDSVLITCTQAKTIHYEITLNRNDLALSKLKKLFRSILWL